MTSRVVALSCLALALGCRSVEPSFLCEGPTDCITSARQGSCEPVGYCSFPTADCPSGRRFDESALNALSGACVVDGVNDAIAFIQPTSCFANDAECTADFAAPNGRGTALIVFAFADGASSFVVGDTRGNAFLSTSAVRSPSGTVAQLWYAQDVSSGANAISVRAPSGTNVGILVAEYAGLAHTGPLLDGAGSQSAPSLSALASTPSVASQSDGLRLLVGAFADTLVPGADAIEPGAGFVARASAPDGRALLQDQLVSGPGASSASARLPRPDTSWVAAAAVFRR